MLVISLVLFAHWALEVFGIWYSQISSTGFDALAYSQISIGRTEQLMQLVMDGEVDIQE
ncbi:hypothetical protein RchiOBHm_Chr1g0324781 [Rosa chinensis]|uniref:Uncharacterized protein n=1 Tax=Rosa chinensis TaxID=74649 RepID=A0A2P6S9T8_ROSCH|nr:hypothetical protein RchiOBHm_Chr1g0324781 [Rosa chinensis]